MLPGTNGEAASTALNACDAASRQLNPVLMQRPTLVIAECVLVYLDAAKSAAVVAALGELLPNAVMVVYEQVGIVKLVSVLLVSSCCRMKTLVPRTGGVQAARRDTVQPLTPCAVLFEAPNAGVYCRRKIFALCFALRSFSLLQFLCSYGAFDWLTCTDQAG